MDTPGHVTSVAHGMVMEVTFWLTIVATTTTTSCQPIQTLDEILRSGKFANNCCAHHSSYRKGGLF